MTTPTQRHIVGYGWQQSGIFLKTRAWPVEASTAVERMPISGTLRLRRHSERLCAGWYDFATDKNHPCPDRNIPRKNQCDACIDREGFAPWLRCDGRMLPALKPAVRAYIDRPHKLYLACFGDDVVKVGMASDQRGHGRLWDQGPLAAYYIAEGDGISIRQLEVEASELGFTEFVRRSRKRDLLTSGMRREDALRRLDSALDRLRAQLPPESLSLLRDPVELPIPALAQRARTFRELEPLKPEDRIIEAEVVAAAGPTLVLNDGGFNVTLDVYDLIAHRVEFNPEGVVERKARQIGLF